MHCVCQLGIYTNGAVWAGAHALYGQEHSHWTACMCLCVWECHSWHLAGSMTASLPASVLMIKWHVLISSIVCPGKRTTSREQGGLHSGGIIECEWLSLCVSSFLLALFHFLSSPSSSSQTVGGCLFLFFPPIFSLSNLFFFHLMPPTPIYCASFSFLFILFFPSSLTCS